MISTYAVANTPKHRARIRTRVTRRSITMKTAAGRDRRTDHDRSGRYFSDDATTLQVIELHRAP
jgi:hypothetical protein